MKTRNIIVGLAAAGSTLTGCGTGYGSAVETCREELKTDIATSYEEVATALAQQNHNNIYVEDPTNTWELGGKDYINKAGEASCVNEDGELVWSIGGLALQAEAEITALEVDE